MPDRQADLPCVQAIVGDRVYEGLLKLAERKRVTLDIKMPSRLAASAGFVITHSRPISP